VIAVAEELAWSDVSEICGRDAGFRSVSASDCGGDQRLPQPGWYCHNSCVGRTGPQGRNLNGRADGNGASSDEPDDQVWRAAGFYRRKIIDGF